MYKPWTLKMMDLELYRAAELGNWDVIKRYEHQLESQLTLKGDTVLHIVSRFCDSSFAVQQIIESKPKLISVRNTHQRDTALHIAARNGHLNVVRVIIDYIKANKSFSRVLKYINKYGNLALHEAIQNSHYEIIKILVEEFPFLTNLYNYQFKCPLYLAVEKGDESVVAMILQSYKPPKCSALIKFAAILFSRVGFVPYDPGRTPLHVAAIWNHLECLRLILRKLPNMVRNVDCFGRTALHYAARFNHQEVAKELLDSNRSIRYRGPFRLASEGLDRAKVNTTDENYIEDMNETPLHVAVIYGHVQIMELLLTYSPDCWNMFTSLGKNIIHLAVENEKQEALDFILKQPWARELVNGIDTKRNTPLHYYATTKNLNGRKLVNYNGVQINALNNFGLTPLDLVTDVANNYSHETQVILRRDLENDLTNFGLTSLDLKTDVVNHIIERQTTLRSGGMKDYRNPISIQKKSRETRPEDKEKMYRRADSYKVVATLIITVSFAAAFTIPGGYEQDNDAQAHTEKGYPVFLKKAAFCVFIASDITAMGCSLISLLLLLGIPGSHFDGRFMSHCNWLIRFAVLALMVAFLTGLFVTIPNTAIRILLLFFLLFCTPHVFMKPA